MIASGGGASEKQEDANPHEAVPESPGLDITTSVVVVVVAVESLIGALGVVRASPTVVVVVPRAAIVTDHLVLLIIIIQLVYFIGILVHTFSIIQIYHQITIVGLDTNLTDKIKEDAIPAQTAGNAEDKNEKIY